MTIVPCDADARPASESINRKIDDCRGCRVGQLALETSEDENAILRERVLDVEGEREIAVRIATNLSLQLESTTARLKAANALVKEQAALKEAAIAKSWKLESELADAREENAHLRRELAERNREAGA